jgi:hypothetical protein
LGKSSTTSSFIIGDVVLEKGNRDDDLCTYEKLSLCNKNVFEENDEDEDDELEEQDEQEEQEEENSSAPLKMDETSASAIDGKKKKVIIMITTTKILKTKLQLVSMTYKYTITVINQHEVQEIEPYPHFTNHVVVTDIDKENILASSYMTTQFSSTISTRDEENEAEMEDLLNTPYLLNNSSISHSSIIEKRKYPFSEATIPITTKVSSAVINKKDELSSAVEAMNTANTKGTIRLVYQDSRCPRCQLWLANNFTLVRHQSKKCNNIQEDNETTMDIRTPHSSSSELKQ